MACSNTCYLLSTPSRDRWLNSRVTFHQSKKKSIPEMLNFIDMNSFTRTQSNPVSMLELITLNINAYLCSHPKKHFKAIFICEFYSKVWHAYSKEYKTLLINWCIKIKTKWGKMGKIITKPNILLKSMESECLQVSPSNNVQSNMFSLSPPLLPLYV